MAAQNDQKSLAVTPNEQQGSSMQRSSNETGFSSKRRPPFLGLGITPQEFLSGNPFALMRRMTEEMDRVIHEFGLERGEGNRTGWSPAIEVTERDGKYSVHAELPGLSPNDVKIEVTNDALVIQGERKVEHNEKDGGVQRTERQYGLFYRSIPLPEGADVNHISANFQNGLLQVTVPVPQQKEERRSIPIEMDAESQSNTQTKAA